jgi:hypothetical protein
VADTPAARIVAIALVLCAVVTTVLAVFLLHRGSDSTATLGQPISVKRALSTTAALFGDRVGAEIDVYTNDTSISASSVQVLTDFRPYRIVSTRVDRSQQNGVSLLRTRLSLQCLTRSCLPRKGETRVFHFAPFILAYKAGASTARVAVPWDPLQVSSRLPVGRATRVGIVDAAPPLRASFRVSPGLLHLLLVLAAVTLSIAAALLIVPVLWPRSFLARRRWSRLSPLERSLVEVEAAAGSDDEGVRRQTLDTLATRLGEVPSGSLAMETRALAWGEHPPEPEALTLLAAQVRTALNGGVRS